MGVVLAAVRTAMRVLSAAAPRTAERVATRMFLTPRRTSRSVPRAANGIPTSMDLRVDGARVRAYRWGRGPAILLVHGWEGRPYHLAAFVPPLVAAGYSVIAPDLPAHGASDGRTADVLQFGRAIARLDDEFGPLHGVVAHSLGAAGTAAAIQRGLRPARVVMIAPVDDAPHFVRTLLRELRLPPTHFPGVMRRLSERVRVPEPEMSAAVSMTGSTIPGLVFHGDRDDDVPSDHGERIAAAWPGARLTRLPGVGHFDILKHPDVLRRSVEFLLAGTEAAVGT